MVTKNMTENTTTERLGSLRLFIEFFGAAIVWVLLLLVGYGLAPIACYTRATWIIVLADGLALLLVLAAAWLAYRSWKNLSESRGPSLVDVDTRGRAHEFMAVSSFLLSSLFFLLVLATFIAAFFLSPCSINTIPFP